MNGPTARQEQRSATETRWMPYDPCPCGCGVVAAKPKLVKPCVPGGCVVGCNSPSCRNRRNQKKGKAAQARMHRELGGTGFTPSNEETARPYTVEVSVMPESKQGAQVPAEFTKFLGLTWTRHALSQSRRSAPVGSGVRPGLYLQPVRGGRWLLVDLGPERPSELVKNQSNDR